MSEDIKIGDQVICIDDEASFNRLRKGDVYTVVANFDGTPTVMVGRASHNLDRFETVARTGSQNLVDRTRPIPG